MNVTRICGILFCVCIAAGELVYVSAAVQPDPDSLFVRGRSWAETMVATRTRFLKWYADENIRQGAWYYANPEAEVAWDEVIRRGIDLSAVDPGGRAQWIRIPRAENDADYTISGKGADVFYVACALHARSAEQIAASVSSSGAFDLYVNGAHAPLMKGSGKSARYSEAQLSLKPGENHVALRIHNVNPRDLGFHFDWRENPAVALWQRIEREFPLESVRMLWDLEPGDHLDWFDRARGVDIEKKMIDHALRDLPGQDAGVLNRYDTMFLQTHLPYDARYLDFYTDICNARRLARELDRIDFRALRMAIEDMGQSFPEQYAAAPELLQKVELRERNAATIRALLAKADAASLKRAEPMVRALQEFQHKALMANPLLDFDELLMIRRTVHGNPYRFRQASRGTGQFIGMPQQSSWQLHTMKDILQWENEIVKVPFKRPDAEMTTVFKPEQTALVTDIDMHWNGDRLLFSMPDKKKFWQLHEMDLATGNVTQVTGSQQDVHSLDGCYLPDGKIMFVSTATFQGVPCNSGVNVGMLYRMDADGSNIRQICFEQDHNFCPTVMNDGRVLYLRWEYTDIPHVWARYLFSMNPDGTEQKHYYGSGSYWPNAIFYARPVPDHPTKVAGIVTGHHVGRIGELYVFDPAEGRHTPGGVVQQIPGYGKPVDAVVMDKLTEDTWPKFLHPYPLSEKYFLAACRPSFEDMWGIYLVDTFDNMTLIKALPGQALLEPLPLKKSKMPPVIPDMTDPSREDAVVYLENVYEGPGLAGVPRGTVKNLRLFTYHFAYRTVAGISHRVGSDGPWEPKRILGTVPVESDGSAMFRIPANTPISIQPLGADGKALQLMRSWMTAMPGEIVSCVGCHEEQSTAPRNRRTAALNKPPEEIKPWYGPVRGFSFLREVQPVLDAYCVGCHDGARAAPDLRREQGKLYAYDLGVPELEEIRGQSAEKLVTKYNGVFPPSYIELRRFIRVGGLESDIRLLAPGEFHADNSELFQLLNQGHYGVRLDGESVERLAAWIDLNAPCHGTWHEVVGTAKIGNDHGRRHALKTMYAGINEDPEDINPAPVNISAAPAAPVPAHRQAPQRPSLSGWPFDEATARQLQHAGGHKERTLQLPGGLTLDLVYVPAGRFIAESPSGIPESKTIDTPFWMSRHEITNAQYGQFDPDHDSRFEDKGSWMFNEWDLGWNLNAPQQPVVRIAQSEAAAFCAWLSDQSGERVQLPTEEQWEYACRAGSETDFSFGTLQSDFSPFANLADYTIRDLAYDVRDNYPPDIVPRDARFNDRFLVTAPVGSFRPNAWDLHDMHGNVWEWTQSIRHDDACTAAESCDGQTSCKVIARGGSWYDRPVHGTASYYQCYPEWQKVFNVGFRVVIPAE